MAVLRYGSIACLLLIFTSSVSGLSIPCCYYDSLEDSLPSQLFPALPNQDDGLNAHSSVAVSGLSKRDDNLDDDLRISQVVILTSTVPMEPAAAALYWFYREILLKATTAWANLPQQAFLSINMGCFQLTMNVGYNRALPRDIPWAFVRNFARNMIRMTNCEYPI